MFIPYFDGNEVNFVFVPKLIFNHADGTWLVRNYLYYSPFRGLCYADQIRVLNSNGAL